MSFTILANSTPTDAIEVNNNFYHVAQGSRLPMGGTSLAATTLVYDLGTTTAYWNNLYCNNVNTNSITTANKSLWIPDSEITLTSPATGISFTGLNGDNAIEYMILIKLVAANAIYLNLAINGDSAVSSYGYQNLNAVSTSITAIRGTSISSVSVTSAGPFSLTLPAYGFSKILFSCKTGIVRMLQNFVLCDCVSTTIYKIKTSVHVWNNSTSTVTSLVFWTNSGLTMAANTNIQLWKRG